jgi:Na+/H+ antiporter NhaD/arsenite permease-like protein
VVIAALQDAGPFKTGAGLAGCGHLGHEWVVAGQPAGLLLLGFSLLANHFEKSEVPAVAAALLPDDWKGGFVLLVLVFVLSSFLDNIAAAMIGGTVAASVFKGRCTSATWRPSWPPPMRAGPAAWWATPPPP